MQITSKGQVTSPQSIRTQLGLLPHTEVEFEIVGDRAQIRKASPKQGISPRAKMPSTLFEAPSARDSLQTKSWP